MSKFAKSCGRSKVEHYDVKPYTPVSVLKRKKGEKSMRFLIADVSPIVGMGVRFIHKVLGGNNEISIDDVYKLLEQDAFQETFVPRSRVIDFLISRSKVEGIIPKAEVPHNCVLCGDAKDLISALPDTSIQCVVTSTPYWAMRIYDEMPKTIWADGEECPLGLEQTPEGFIRHSIEVLYGLLGKIKIKGSVWWNIMDTYNTRTQIRTSAVEALRAMQGKDKKSWKDHKFKRYSCGHSFLKDGEQCLIPYRIAERASRIGYYVKSVISWCKSSSLPEPQLSRVSRDVEYVLHLSKSRTPLFNKDCYLSSPPEIGGKQQMESEKLSDFWYLPTSPGRDGHGAQFPMQLPGRCISLSSNKGDVVLDPFSGSGTTLLAAQALGRNYLGFDVVNQYVQLSRSRLSKRTVSR